MSDVGFRISGPLFKAGLSLCLACILAACALPGEVASPRDGEQAAVDTAPADEQPSVEAAESVDAGEADEAVQPLTREMLFDVLLGEIAGQRGRLDIAVPHYLQAALDSRDPRVAERAIQIATFAKNYPVALRAARHWVALEPDNTDARKIVAALALQTGDMDEVVNQLDHVIRSSESKKQGFAIATAILSRHGDDQQSIQAIEELAARHPESADGQLAIGRLATVKGQLERAMTATDAALALQPGMEQAQILKAQVLIRQERKDEALAVLKQAVEDSPDSSELRFAYGRLLLDAGDLEGAKAQFRNVVEKTPENTDALFSLALLELETGEYRSAERHLKQMLETGEKKQTVYYYLGYAAQEQGKDDEAVKWYGKVTSGEYWTKAQLRMSKIQVQQGRLEEVRENMQSLRRNDPDNAVEIYLIEGQILSDLTLYNEAWQLYDQALAAHADNEDLLYSRALTSEKIDRIDLAEKDMRRILELDPENVRALNALGYTLADRTDRYEEAFSYIQQAYDRNPDDPAIIDSMGWVHYRLGNLEKARGYLQQAWDMTGDGEIGAHLGEVMWMQGDRDDARRIWAESKESSPDNPVLKKVLDRFMP
jgi:tetratricopeptide (TPR) repeat protein